MTSVCKVRVLGHRHKMTYFQKFIQLQRLLV